MIKREDVEALLAVAQKVALASAVFGPERIGVEGPTLAALCRAWLAVDAGDQCEVVDSNWSEFGVIYSVVPELIGCRVRIVKEID